MNDEWGIEPNGPDSVLACTTCGQCGSTFKIALPRAIVMDWYRRGVQAIAPHLSGQTAVMLERGMCASCTGVPGRDEPLWVSDQLPAIVSGHDELRAVAGPGASGLPGPFTPPPYPPVLQSQIEGRQLPHHGDSYPKPDFVLFGIADKHGGVILFASGDLNKARMETTESIETVDIPGFRNNVRLPKRKTELEVEFEQHTMIRADTYIEALRSLGESGWHPPEPGQRAIGS